MENNTFKTLNSVNVSGKTEKKNGLTYLSWAWAWGEVKKAYPAANYKVYETADGAIYWTDKRTCWVKVSVTIEGLEHTEYLPVMDFRNASITADKITSVDVNKTIQRALTKAIARHGLGLYIYAGEDMPEEDKDHGAQVIPSHGIESKHSADVDALKAVAEKAKATYKSEPAGVDWDSPAADDKWVEPTDTKAPIGQKTTSGVIKKYYPLNGKKPHCILVDKEFYSTYHEGIGKQMEELAGMLVKITYRDEPYEYKGEARINHVVDAIGIA